jgi:murein DD-endopeptidase MepM/ murein hydrolase activator NlpD
MKFRLTSEFGALEEVRNGTPHNGIDIAMPEGTELHSIAEGVVERVVDYGSENIGKGVIIRADDGTRSIYGHMSEIDVRSGEHVDKGELLGLSGSTGNSTGAHLHFGIWKDGEYVDPAPMTDQLMRMSGDIADEGKWYMFGIDTKIDNAINESVDDMKQEMIDGIIAFLGALRDVAIDLSFSIALIGGGLSIILWVAGFQKGMRWAGILFVANVLIKTLLGGYL